ncbi:hypothetical protein PFBG_04126 [Plasmodium falciparum 7G8]|uniref:Erythrocyte membrane protein 1 n=1 Tax=Plasmodium falciparum (isolate 7G8) TaxID=57266 RepID=W7F899_PLAF8|nr:hypothetical protein PFBG_04126 [Plasmodium falciparum 7G8]
MYVKKKCECFESWVKQKKEQEWTQIKEHFKKQNIGALTRCNPFVTLEYLFMDGDLLKNIEDTHADVKEDEIKNIREMLKETVLDGPAAASGIDGVGRYKCTEGDNGKHNTKIDKFLDHEKGIANTCVKNNPTDKCEDTPGVRSIDPDSDEDFSEDEEPPPEEVENPCATPSGSTYPVLAEKVAKEMQETAHQKMIENSVKNSVVHGKGKSGESKSSLIGDISKAQFKDGTKANGLTEDVCDITDQHSNDDRSQGEPCHGKDRGNGGERMKIGTEWSHIKEKEMSYKEVYLPPRRQHMCTSNLEHLETGQSPLKNSDGKVVNNSFLGDVLLSAKYEAKKIMELYEKSNEQNETKNQETLCRAVRYSFADLGDIIRGRDMWDEDSGAKHMENNFKKIFEKIKKHPEIQGKYNTDGPPYKKLREDWWEANRRQVWNAMTCPTKNGIICPGMPVDDYIPQRLRWMTEWAEWFCKMQSQEYDTLQKACKECKAKGDGKDCTQKDNDCEPCKQACDNYKKVVGEWEKQWNNMLVQYLMLDYGANTTAPYGINSYVGAVGDKDKPVVEFFKELQKEIKNSDSKRPKRSTDGTTTDPIFTSPYSSAEGYIHQEMGPHMECKEQNVFCPSGGSKYAFKEPPKGYEDACSCNTRDKTSEAPVTKKEDDACEIVKKLLENQESPEYKEACQLKYKGKKEKHTNWKCTTNKTKKGQEDDVCIPPRRQKLYLGNLEKLNGEKSQQELRTAFIKAAAMETFFLWHRYKEEKKPPAQEGAVGLLPINRTLGDDKDPQSKLLNGEIPPEFLRQMFYTLGDYRDILVRGGHKDGSGKEIVVHTSGNKQDMDKIQKKIDEILNNQSGNNKGTSDTQQQTERDKREKWWTNNARRIWEGMLFSLTYDIMGKSMNIDVYTKLTSTKSTNYKYENVIFSGGLNGNTKLEEFSRRPTFFRWLQEWGEEFCTKRTDKLKKVKDKCQGFNTNNYKIYCSGDGYDCTEKELKHNKMFTDINCLDCEKECTNYKKWIQKKVEEFYKQKSKYPSEHGNLSTCYKDDCDQKFYKEIKKTDYSSIHKFLELLNHCKNDGDNSDQDNKIDFTRPLKTFSPSTYCKTCPLSGVNCRGNICNNVQGNKLTWENVFNGKYEAINGTTNIDVEMVDRRGINIDKKFEQLFKKSCLFKSVRDQKWKCTFINENIDVCKLDNFNNDIDINEYITFKILLEHWLQDFIEGYYILNKKIEQCTKGENSVIERCTNKCECVKIWIEKKEKEWNQIKTHFNKRERDDRFNMAFKVQNFFEKNESILKKFIHNYDDLKNKDEYEDYINDGTCGPNNKGIKKDMVSFLLSEIKEKIHNANGKPGEPQPNCDEIPPHSDETLDEQTDTTTDDDNSDKIYDTKPPFCPKDVEDTKETEKPKVLPGPPDACKIVKELLKDKGETDDIDGCKQKEDKKNPYPSWKCDENMFENNEDGPCMPPRRQKLCIHDLKVLTNTSSEKQLREAFIKCAAKEVYWLWKKYKEDKVKEKPKGVTEVHAGDPQQKLEIGTIPDDFKRMMFYTYGDYRDFLFGTDISRKNANSDLEKVKNNIDNVFINDPQTKNTERQDWWKIYGKDIWEGMVCGLSHHIKEAEREKFTNSEAYKYSTVSSRLEDFASRPQFLRWFTEWADQFCRERVVKFEELKEKCETVNCNNKDEGNQRIKEECEKECKKYEEWLQGWKDQYKKQSAKFDKDKKAGNYEHTSAQEDVDVSSAHDYLHEQLEKLCINGDCKCMENSSIQDDETDLPGKNDLPEALDNPPKEFEEKCECSEHSEAMSCVEKTAQKLRKDAEKNVKNYESSLKGNGKNYNGTCNLIEKQNSTNGEYSCEFEKLYPNAIKSLNVSCDNNGKERFKIEEEWKCDGHTADGKNKLCIPPRRKYMCLKNLENIVSTNISNNNTLLQKIQDIAKNEGDNIIKNLLPKYPCNENIICDAMKYSFADIGDIIRGRIRIKPNNDNNIEEKLQEIFTNLKTRNNSFRNIDLTQFREKWWDANRKEVWKAMTCNAPKDAHLKKRINKLGESSQNTDAKTEKEKCGNDKEPPDYDYIPERHRSLQEWSEYYCKTLIEKNDEMKNKCSECLKNGTCENENNKENCKECIRKCKDYSKFVDKWKAQFEEQNEIYKELYTHARSYGPNAARRDFSIKFIQQLDKICEDPNNAEKYLDKSTHCTDYKFSETNNNENDAFSQYPKDFKDKCKCKEKPLPSHLGKNVISFIQNSFKPPKIPGLKTIQNVVPQIPRTIKNIWPDAHTIHELVARSFDYFVPKFPKQDKLPPTHNILNDVLPSAIPVGIALALTSIAFLFLKKKTKSSVGNLFQILQIPKSDYDIPTKLSPNRYIPYTSGKYRGKRYIYLEGDSGTDSGYTDHYSDITSSSESEYEELDINDIYVPGSPKYKTLIEVVLEPSGNNTTASGTLHYVLKK